MEIKNNLLNFSNKVIYQNSEWFMFSLDSVILANFVNIKPNDKRIVDLAAGNAAISMLMTYRTNANIWAIELQKEIYELGCKSIVANEMEEQINLINGDIRNIESYYKSEFFDVVVCNPPFFKTTSERHLNECDIKRIARHEITLNLDQLFCGVRYILKNKGTFAMVHRPDRLVEIVDKMREYGIEPKRIQFIYPKVGKDSNILLIEGVKNGGVGLKVMKPLIVHNDDGSYTDEVKKMFGE